MKNNILFKTLLLILSIFIILIIVIKIFSLFVYILIIYFLFLVIKASLSSSFYAPRRLFFVLTFLIILFIFGVGFYNFSKIIFSSFYQNGFNLSNSKFETYLFYFYLMIIIISFLLFIELILKYRNRRLYKKTLFDKVINDFLGPKLYLFIKPNYNLPSVSLAKGLTEKLIKKDLEGYLKKDFRAATYLSYGDYFSKRRTKDKLQALMLEIFLYLKLSPFVKLKIIYEGSKEDNFENQIGQYKTSFLNKTITLKISKELNPNNIISVLCHECVHYFMEVHNLNVGDINLNERQTDVLTNLLGFSKIMKEGYQKSLKIKDDGYLRTTTTTRVGYITSKECSEIRKYLIYIRRKGIVII